MIGEYISKDYIAMQLHAMAELISLFLSKDITIDECCKELNISDFQQLIRFIFISMFFSWP